MGLEQLSKYKIIWKTILSPPLKNVAVEKNHFIAETDSPTLDNGHALQHNYFSRTKHAQFYFFQPHVHPDPLPIPKDKEKLELLRGASDYDSSSDEEDNSKVFYILNCTKLA